MQVWQEKDKFKLVFKHIVARYYIHVVTQLFCIYISLKQLVMSL